MGLGFDGARVYPYGGMGLGFGGARVYPHGGMGLGLNTDSLTINITPSDQIANKPSKPPTSILQLYNTVAKRIATTEDT
jgi:hypothetical protein